MQLNTNLVWGYLATRHRHRVYPNMLKESWSNSLPSLKVFYGRGYQWPLSPVAFKPGNIRVWEALGGHFKEWKVKRTELSSLFIPTPIISEYSISMTWWESVHNFVFQLKRLEYGPSCPFYQTPPKATLPPDSTDLTQFRNYQAWRIWSSSATEAVHSLGWKWAVTEWHSNSGHRRRVWSSHFTFSECS